jgi:hypothetical protein
MVLDPGVKSQGNDVDAESEGPVLQWETLRMPGWWNFLLDFRENCNSFMGIKIKIPMIPVRFVVPMLF